MAVPDPGRATTLPLDELALEVLADLVARNEWNEYDYLNSASQDGRYRRQDAAVLVFVLALNVFKPKGMTA